MKFIGKESFERCRFDVALLIKSFNRLSNDEKQKILKNLLQTLKSDGQVFVYESEWTKEQGRTIYFPGESLRIFILPESHSSNPVDLIHYFNSAEKDKHGFELVYARPLRGYVEVNLSLVVRFPNPMKISSG